MSELKYKGIRFESLRCSYPDGFAIELWRRGLFRRRSHVATVFLPETGDELTYEVHLGPASAPSEFVDSFIADAKLELQQWRTEWAANIPNSSSEAD